MARRLRTVHSGVPDIPARPVLLLLDGDDPGIERERRRPLLPAPHRLYFYRQPTVASLLHCISSRANACLENWRARKW